MNKKILLPPFMFLSFMVFGCSMSTRGVATITANEIHDIAAEENKVITKYCVPKYKEAKTKQDVEKADKVCLKAEASYYSVRAAWKTLVYILEAAKINKVTDKEIKEAVITLTNVLIDLQKTSDLIKESK